MSSSQTIQILVLAAIAVFLVLRLRNLLGTRDGFEPTDEPAEAPAPRHLKLVPAEPEDSDDDIAAHVDADSPAAAALHAMRKAEPGFTVGPFLTGARQAYEMILMAFERGDLGTVRPFLSDAVAGAFQSVIDARKAEGRVVEAEFLGTRETSLITADFNPDSRDAEITIRFVGEMTSATRDAAGAVVEGDPRHPRKQRDTWTFGRRMGDADPNWRLIATG